MKNQRKNYLMEKEILARDMTAKKDQKSCCFWAGLLFSFARIFPPFPHLSFRSVFACFLY